MASKHGAVWQSDPKPQRLRFYILYFLQVLVYLITTSLVKRYFQLLAQKRESTLFVLLNEIIFTFVKYYILFFFRIWYCGMLRFAKLLFQHWSRVELLLDIMVLGLKSVYTFVTILLYFTFITSFCDNDLFYNLLNDDCPLVFIYQSHAIVSGCGIQTFFLFGVALPRKTGGQLPAYSIFSTSASHLGDL